MKKQNKIILCTVAVALVAAYLWKKHNAAVGEEAAAEEGAPAGGGGGGGSVHDPATTAVTAVAGMPMPMARVSTTVVAPSRLRWNQRYPGNSLAMASKSGGDRENALLSSGATRPRTIGGRGSTESSTGSRVIPRTGGVMPSTNPRTGGVTPITTPKIGTATSVQPLNGRAVVNKGVTAQPLNGKAAVNKTDQNTASNFSGDAIINPVFI